MFLVGGGVTESNIEKRNEMRLKETRWKGVSKLLIFRWRLFMSRCILIIRPYIYHEVLYFARQVFELRNLSRGRPRRETELRCTRLPFTG